MMQLRGFELTGIAPEELQVGQPIPWAVYDEFGKLLLAKGARVRSQHQRDVLVQVGLHVPTQSNQAAHKLPQPVRFNRRINPFAEFDELCMKLQEAFKLIEQEVPPRAGLVEKRIYEIVTTLQGLSHYDADALLGAVHLSDQFPYHLHHPMQMAVLTELILKRLRVEQEIQLPAIGAALTCNIAMNHYQQQLHLQRQPLSLKQRRVINKHPLQSARMLAHAGVDSELWLELVRQHHEKLDGTGYPLGLKGDDIRREARILALADVYSAMVTARPYRPPIQHKDSLRELFIKRGESFDEKLTLLFLNELGLYPPGVYVRLNNGERAVVVGRTTDPKAPVVASIKKADGNFFISPRRRNTGAENFAICSTCGLSDRHPINPAMLWGVEVIRLAQSFNFEMPDLI